MALVRVVVEGVPGLRDLEVQFGGVTALVGPRGAGKSRLLTAISWLLTGAPALVEPEDSAGTAMQVEGTITGADSTRIVRRDGGGALRPSVAADRLPAVSFLQARDRSLPGPAAGPFDGRLRRPMAASSDASAAEALVEAIAIDLTLERHRDLLRRGAILVDDQDYGTSPRVLFYLGHAIQDGSLTRPDDRRVTSRQMLYVEIDADGVTRHLQYAPYLDYRPLTADEPGAEAVLERPECSWIGHDLEQAAQQYAVAEVVPGHLAEVRGRKLELIDKTEGAVRERLTKEISYWDHRAEELKLAEQAGKVNARLNSDEARKRADSLQGRLAKRMDELALERQISPLPPVVLGGLLVMPAGLIAAMTGRAPVAPPAMVDTQAAAARARAAVMEVERALGFEPTDRENDKLGYDIESRIPGTGRLRFIEVKGRVAGAQTVTVTKNEILYSLNKPDDFILAVVAFHDDGSERVHYVRRPFQREPDFGAASVNYDLTEMLSRAEPPR